MCVSFLHGKNAGYRKKSVKPQVDENECYLHNNNTLARGIVTKDDLWG